MTTIDHIFFSFRAGANGLGIGLGIAVALIGVLLLLFTRFSINKKWSGGAKLMFVQALILIVMTMSYLGLQKGSEYISKKEYDLNSELSEDPVWRQTGLVRAWETLTKEGGQSGLTSPDEGGNEISLRSGAEAEIYSGILAEVIQEELESRITNPQLVEFTSPEEVTAFIFETPDVVTMEYPQTLVQDNLFANEVLKHRVEEYYTAYREAVDSGRAETNLILTTVAIASLIVSIVFIGIGAWKDLMHFGE